MTAASTLGNYTDLSRFSAIRAQAGRDADGAMHDVASEFEAMFIQMMLKAARDASDIDSTFDSQEVRFYREMFDNQVALQMAREGRLGFAALLQRQIPHKDAQNNADIELKLPERKIFPETAPYRPVPEPDTSDEVVDIATWQAQITNRGLADRERGFAASLLTHAKRAADRLGTTPEVLLAQAALETGWGKHVMRRTDGASSHNLFGIKADRSWSGDTVTRRTLEYFDGKPVRVNAAFRAYDSFGAAFDDYAAFIEGNPRYRAALTQAGDPRAYAHALQSAGYATDPRYAQKIVQIHDQIAARTTRDTE